MRTRRAVPPPLPSPNIWHWPQVYEIENRAQDVDGAIWAVLEEVAPVRGLDVVDVGCGAGFHLPQLVAAGARSVVGVEPHPPLVELARARTASEPRVRVQPGQGEALGLADRSVDVVHARTACFFGAGCERAIAEAVRVLRPGGVLVVVDLDATRSPYGTWMRLDLPRYDPVGAERFFTTRGFGLRRVDTVWRFERRADLEAVLGIEFSPRTAARAVAQTPDLTLDVAYRVQWWRPGAATGRPDAAAGAGPGSARRPPAR